jgi:hypothetical protein
VVTLTLGAKPSVSTDASYRCFPRNRVLSASRKLRERSGGRRRAGARIALIAAAAKLCVFFAHSVYGEYQTNWSALFAGLTIAVLPLIILFVVATNQIVEGLTSG